MRDHGAARRPAMTNVIKLPSNRGEGEPGLFLVSPGEYDAVYIRYVCYNGIFGKTQQKVRLDFRLLESPGITLSRWYRVTHSRGRIAAYNSSDIVRELSVALRQRVRRDRIPIASLANMVLRVRVHTVTKNRDQKHLHEINQYSVIAELLGRSQ